MWIKLGKSLDSEIVQLVPESLQINSGRYDLFLTDSACYFPGIGENALQATRLSTPDIIGTSMPFSPLLSSVFFLLFFFSIMIIAFIFRWEGTALKDNFKNVFNPGKHSASMHKSQVTNTEAWGELFMVFQAIIIFSILLFIVWYEKGLSSFTIEVQSLGFVGIFAGFALLIVLKILFYRLIGSFFLRNEMKGLITYYYRMIEILGIVFFLPAVFYVYLHEVRNIILIALIIFFFISRLALYIQVLNIFVKNKIALFYFFVYLCGTEIAPYFMLYKVVFSAINFAGENIL